MLCLKKKKEKEKQKNKYRSNIIKILYFKFKPFNNKKHEDKLQIDKISKIFANLKSN